MINKLLATILPDQSLLEPWSLFVSGGGAWGLSVVWRKRNIIHVLYAELGNVTSKEKTSCLSSPRRYELQNFHGPEKKDWSNSRK